MTIIPNTGIPNTGPADALPPSATGWQARARAVLDSRRRVGSLVIHAPAGLRALVRGDELWLVALAAVIGVLSGGMVAAMNTVTQMAHTVLFRLPEGVRLSSATAIPVASALLVPALGGLAMGVLGLGLARWWPRAAVDPIEANALYGGTMSLRDSLVLVAQTVLSNSAGASLGLEAGFTQIGSAIASRIGRAFRVRRADLRVLVGCGAAGAIGAAFNAPLTGAFYAFELVIGTYSLATLAPVMAAAICAIATVRVLSGDVAGFDVHVPSAITPLDYVPLLALGIVASLGGIALMRGVTLTEQAFHASRVPVWLRPAIGGAIVGVLALVTPQVMSSGHGALRMGLDAPYSLGWLAVLIALKSVASAVSIGAGFRGGLFFASLFIGALVGKLFAAVLALAAVGSSLPDVVCAVVGMSALAVAVVGGPLTMSFLALESTGSLPLTIAVLAAAVLSSLTVRRTFGYSFATWRFHLRGEAIRSAVDIGWVRNLTVGRMMRKDIRTVPVDTAPASFRRDYPLGSTQRVVMVDAAGRYAGIVFPAEAHAVEAAELPLGALLHYPQTVLLPQMTVKEAIAAFEAAESDALAVVDGPDSRQVIGLLTEQHALRRYSEELDLRRRELSGEG
jgi:CIC family chloride channel protein